MTAAENESLAKRRKDLQQKSPNHGRVEELFASKLTLKSQWPLTTCYHLQIRISYRSVHRLMRKELVAIFEAMKLAIDGNAEHDISKAKWRSCLCGQVRRSTQNLGLLS